MGRRESRIVIQGMIIQITEKNHSHSLDIQVIAKEYFNQVQSNLDAKSPLSHRQSESYADILWHRHMHDSHSDSSPVDIGLKWSRVKLTTSILGSSHIFYGWRISTGGFGPCRREKNKNKNSSPAWAEERKIKQEKLSDFEWNSHIYREKRAGQATSILHVGGKNKKKLRRLLFYFVGHNSSS